MEIKRDRILIVLVLIFFLAGMLTTFWEKDREARIALYVLLVSISIFFTWYLVRKVVARNAKKEFRGRPIFEGLPNGKIFIKLYESRLADTVHLFLEDTKTRDEHLYAVQTNKLLNEKGEKITEIPEKFQVKRGTKIDIGKSTDLLHEYACERTVYYLYPVSSPVSKN